MIDGGLYKPNFLGLSDPFLGLTFLVVPLWRSEVNPASNIAKTIFILSHK